VLEAANFSEELVAQNGSMKSEGRRMKSGIPNFIIHTSTFCLSPPCFSSITAMAWAVSKVGFPSPRCLGVSAQAIADGNIFRINHFGDLLLIE